MRRLTLLAAGLLWACGISFAPRLMHHVDRLEPVPAAEAADETLAFTREGLRVEVEALTDEELNALFPDDSQRGRFSTNPYTYGDWVDPVLGYTPVRFTVFRVTVVNDIYAKVLLDPLKATLYTDQGEELHSYGIPSFSPHESFERYYRALRGQSGNEFYRFDLRMGNVRSTAYLEDQLVFKGERYAGLIAFDPLREEVQQVRLVLPDFVLRFDASGQPAETVDMEFDFDRVHQIGPMAAAE